MRRTAVHGGRFVQPGEAADRADVAGREGRVDERKTQVTGHRCDLRHTPRARVRFERHRPVRPDERTLRSGLPTTWPDAHAAELLSATAGVLHGAHDADLLLVGPQTCGKRHREQVKEKDCHSNEQQAPGASALEEHRRRDGERQKKRSEESQRFLRSESTAMDRGPIARVSRMGRWVHSTCVPL